MALPLAIPRSADSKGSCSNEHILRPCLRKAEQSLAQLNKRFQEWQEYQLADRELSAAVAAHILEKDGAAGDAGNTKSKGSGRSETEGENGSDGKIPPLANPNTTLDGVTRLLSRLEVMERMLSGALYFEKQVVNDLRTDLRTLEKSRLDQIPKIAQHEHDEYFVNLTELEWQATYMGRQETRLDHKLAGAEGQLKRITQELDFFEEFKPVMVQKMAEDKEATIELQKEDERMSDLLAQHDLDLVAAENKLMIETQTTHMASLAIQSKVQSTQDALWRVQQELAKLKNDHSGLVHKLITTRSSLSSSRDHLRELENDIVQDTEKHEEYSEKISSMMVSIKEALTEQEQEDENNERLAGDRQLKFSSEQAIEENRLAILSDVRREQHVAQEKLKSMRADVKRMETETTRADRDVVQANKSFERSKKELNRIQEQMAVASEECAKMREEKCVLDKTIHATRQALREGEAKVAAQLDRLKRDEEDEDKQLSLLQARIIADQHQMRDSYEASKQKQTEGCEMLVKVEGKKQALAEKAEELSKQWETCEETLTAVREEVNDVATELREVEEDFHGQIAPLQPVKQQLSGDVLASGNLIKELEWEHTMLTKKLQDTTDSRTAIDRLMQLTTQEIDDKMAELESKEQIIREGRDLERKMASELKEIQTFRREAGDKHGKYMKVQHEMLQAYMDDLLVEVSKNKELAEHYKQSQMNSMHAKTQLTETLEQRSQLDESLRDHKQLIDWQRRMHRTLESVYQKRQQDGRHHLMKFTEEARQNTDSLVRVEQDLSGAVRSVKTFLRENDL